MHNTYSFPSHRALRTFLVALLIGLLAACAGPARKPAPVADPLAQQASGLADAGQYRAAAEVYLNAARTAEGLDAVRYRLRAAGYLLDTGDLAAVERLLDGIEPAALPEPERINLHLVRARLELARHRPDLALDQLRASPVPEADSPHVKTFHRLRAEAYSMAGNRLESARERVWLDGLLVDPAAREANQRAIWEALSGLSDSALERLRTSPPPDVLSGWMELVRIARDLRRPGVEAEPALAAWRARYPRHPAETSLLPELLATPATGIADLRRIAVLLPLSGSLAAPAAAVRDGILAAHFALASGDAGPELRFYDTGDQVREVWTLYQRAIAEGAQLVIGPLRKEAVQVLSDSGTLDIPVLALNQIETGPHPALFQFGLAPEDEARQAAERARWDGHSGAAVLIPEGPWADRVYNAFAARWTELGGEIRELQRYPARQVDFGAAIQALLNLDESINRERALTRLLGRSLEFVPRRRQDVDFVFLLATPQDARQIKPQLRFHHASDLPVYTTSFAYTGHVDESRDQDLNGIRFCDMPWILAPDEAHPGLRQRLERLWPDDMKRHARLYALGIDAYQLLPYLQQPGMHSLNGVTGNLSIDHEHRIHRELRWAEFRRGQPRLLEPALEVMPVEPDGMDLESPDAIPPMEIMDEPPANRSPR